MPSLTITPQLRLHYLDLNPGGRPTVLLLHGLGASGAAWQLQFAPLVEAGFRAVAPDARGFGRSTYPGGGQRVSDMAGDMALLLESLHLSESDPAHVVGISMGGAVALRLALDRPGQVRKLVLVSTFARLRPERLSGWAYFGLRFAAAHVLGVPAQARVVARRLFPRPEQQPLRDAFYGQVIQADPRGYRATMRSLGRFDVRPRLHEIRAPTLIVTGGRDTTVPPRRQLELLQIPGARQFVVPDAGHAVIADQPQRFNSALVEFLRD